MQRRFYILVAFVLVFTNPLRATHIVGGEFELEHLEGYNYELRLIQYFDVFYGNPGAEDPLITASIFQKSNNAFITSVNLDNSGSVKVEYTNVDCAIGELNTKKIIYKTNIFLDPSIYNHPEGYYVVWERCCRNNVIDNIITPEASGQSFYLEFPPVIINGEQFINSSPQLFPPLSDYGCVGQFYYVDFTGTDADNDSLAYTLVDPIRGFSSQAQPAPPPSPAPYPRVTWAAGISTQNMVPGNPALQISKNGLLTVTPSREGLFVFSVKCEEFRNGQKIGEVVRDFQMLVIDCPAPGAKPELFVKIKGEENFYSGNQVISFNENEPKCIQVFVKDADPQERINFRIAPISFNGERNIFRGQQGMVNGANDTLVMELCFPECALSDDEIAVFDLIAMDDQCSQPLMDSVRLRINQVDSYNQQPFFTNDNLDVIIDEGDNFNFTITARDNDLDSIALNLVPVGFDLAQYGITFVPVKVEDGLVQYNFGFDASCGQYDFNDDVIEINFLANDFNQCNDGFYDTLNLKIRVNLPVNTLPEISLDPDERNLNVRINQSIIFDVLGKDIDNDLISLSAFGDGFDMQSLGMVFNEASGFGTTQSRFTWRLNCEQVDLANQDEFKVIFLVEDRDDCLVTSPDTISVRLNVRPPRNERPQVFTEIQPFRTIGLNPGDSLSFDVLAVDNDGDNLILDLKDLEMLENQYGVQFSPESGGSRIISEFRWFPTCEQLNGNFGPNVINLKFYARDDKCFNNRSDTTTVEVFLSDQEGNYDDFNPINVFTPNGDDKNEFFFLDDLPIDNCRAEFIDINIFNRWGKPIFYSRSRDFAWNGDQAPSGVYYYVIQYTNDLVYKGTVSLIR